MSGCVQDEAQVVDQRERRDDESLVGLDDDGVDHPAALGAGAPAAEPRGAPISQALVSAVTRPSGCSPTAKSAIVSARKARHCGPPTTARSTSISASTISRSMAASSWRTVRITRMFPARSAPDDDPEPAVVPACADKPISSRTRRRCQASKVPGVTVRCDRSCRGSSLAKAARTARSAQSRLGRAT